MILSKLAFLFFLPPINAFLPIDVARTKNVWVAPTTIIRAAKDSGEIGHLEPIPKPDSGSGGESPGLPDGAESWPSPIQEPSAEALEDSDTPGLRKGVPDWPSPMREPEIGFGSGPCDTPGLPPDSSSGIPPHIQEPRVRY